MSTTSNEPINKDYFKIHFFLLKLFGVPIRPIKNSIMGILYKIYCIIIFVTVHVYFPVGEILYAINTQDVDNITLIFSFVLSHVLGVLKAILVVLLGKKIDTFCKYIETEPFLPDRNRSGDIEFTYVKEAVSKCTTQIYIFNGMVVAIVLQKLYNTLRHPTYGVSFRSGFTNTTLVKPIRSLPFNCLMPFSIVDPFYYAIAVTYTTVCAAYLGFIIGVIDAIICGIMYHLKCQLLILENCLKTYIQRATFLMKEERKDIKKNELEILNNFTEKSTDVLEIPSILQRYVTICVNEIIEHHQKIYNLADGAEATFSLLMLVQFSFSLAMICFLLFQLSILQIGSVQFNSMTLYLVLMLFQLYLFCRHGNEVMLYSCNIMYAIFESNWIVADLTTQKSLLIMMIRAYRPIKMTAGKFVFLSLEAFISILRGSGSYFMALRSNTNR